MGFGLGFISSVTGFGVNAVLKLMQKVDLQALRGLVEDEDEDGFPAGGAGACWAISSLVMASSGSESVEDILESDHIQSEVKERAHGNIHC
jgi:hypothetical protein